MSKKTKTERRDEAVRAERQRRVDRLYALSFAFLRVETAYEKFREEAAKLLDTGKTEEELAKLEQEVPQHIGRLANHPLIRSGSSIMVYFGLLYALVEAWKKWGHEHPAVDDLLKSPFVEELKKYRHAVFHVNELTDPRIMQWTGQQDRVVWTKQLLVAFRVALLDWHDDLAQQNILIMPDDPT